LVSKPSDAMLEVSVVRLWGPSTTCMLGFDVSVCSIMVSVAIGYCRRGVKLNA
jgi:hypothetical protein